jgi:hypothetical protein
VWHWPWTASGGSSPSSAHYRRRNPPPQLNFNHVTSEKIRSLKLGKACSIDGIPNESFRHLPWSLVYVALQKPRKNPKCHKNNYVRQTYCPLRVNLLRK